MSRLKTYHVAVWDRSLFEATVRARSGQEALEYFYAAASLPECDGFELRDNYGDGWQVSAAPSAKRKQGAP